MKFIATPIAGAYLVEVEPQADERGTFARTFGREEFTQHGLNPAVAQCSFSTNRAKGTLRGMHYQGEPYGECKLVRCTHGAIHDVVADLRRDSPSYRRWYAAELSRANGRAFYIPNGVAHGFLTLTEDAEVFYQISEPYRAEYTRGFRWNDPAFGIAWPAPPTVISARDRDYPDLAL